MLHSTFKPLTSIQLPFNNRRMYMHSFDIEKPIMAAGYEDYLDAVETLLSMAGIREGRAHMTVDEQVVKAGHSQRRPGPHVDGCFMPDAIKPSWGHGGGGGWLHKCNNIPIEVPSRMPVIIASSVPGCRAWTGKFDGEPKSDGDLSHLVLGEGEVLPANVGYLLSPDCVHESMIFDVDTPRTFLRIALPSKFKPQGGW